VADKVRGRFPWRNRPRCCPGESPANRAPATRQGHLSRRLHRLPWPYLPM